MPKIALLTDSTANLPREWIEKYPIEVVPLKIHWRNRTFLDGVDVKPDEFYRSFLRDGWTLPTTSQPAVQDFLQAFENQPVDVEGILVVLISSGISGTVSAAQAAAGEYTRIPVEIVDTRTTSVGQAMIVQAVARAAAQGRSLAELRHMAEDMARRGHTFFAVDTLKYLHRGGRINGAARLLGTALEIKPILFINPEGKIDALESVRTRRKALQRLVSLAMEQAGGRRVHVGIVHANSAHLADELRHEIQKRLDCVELITLELSPVIGVHVGPGTVGIAIYSPDLPAERNP
jgi:DegV family protein with EDD domain